ncbi:MAG: hypothetical protein A3F11_05760 [Gammaproteobacteria bacterium RIFCSPHIGHO2_12_FULL_37_14]|nr:MAG: hypothetical protein A3F11_05760 [Gammaproteobacteria bacterium RIFCSPHIGHO2_12_FULL_37_14]
MAAPVTHILLALQILPSLPDKDEKEFIIGTSFPDIRYLNCISRDKTHQKDVTLEKIKAEQSSFKAGMMFHALVDEVREKFMQGHKVYSLVPKSIVTAHALKFNEDALLSDKVPLYKVASYFDVILPEELDLVNYDYAKTWHKALKKYLLDFHVENCLFKFLKRCAKRRFNVVDKTFLNNIKRIALEKVNEILYNKLEWLIEKANSDPKITQLVNEFYEKFTTLI